MCTDVGTMTDLTGYAGRTDNLIIDNLYNVLSVQRFWLGKLGTRRNLVLGIVMTFAGYPVKHGYSA